MDRVSGAAASTPVIAAVLSVWRTFFNIVPFAVRAPKQTQRSGRVPVSWRVYCFESRRLVQARQRGREPPTGLLPGGCTGASSPSAAPAHTRFRGFDLYLPLSGRKGPYENELHSSSCDTPLSRTDNGL